MEVIKLKYKQYENKNPLNRLARKQDRWQISLQKDANYFQYIILYPGRTRNKGGMLSEDQMGQKPPNIQVIDFSPNI